MMLRFLTSGGNIFINAVSTNKRSLPLDDW